MIGITQHVEQTGDAEFTVKIQVGDNEPTSETFKRTNKVFPAFRSLIDTLQTIEDQPVSVATNFDKLVEEFNSLPNRNQTHLQHLRDVVARNGITLTISYSK